VTTNQLLIGLGLTVALAVGSQVLASRLRIPALIVLLPGQLVPVTERTRPAHRDGDAAVFLEQTDHDEDTTVPRSPSCPDPWRSQ
jgi:NhaP-type Na+/H+ or K+/H+ antiporter